MIPRIIKTIIFRLALMPHTRQFIVGAVDDAQERAHFRGMLVELGLSASAVGLVFTVLFTNILMGPVQDAPVVGPLADKALPDTNPVNILARAPGTDPKFALNFCNDPATVVQRPRFPVPEASGQLVASRGTDTLTWQGPGTVTALYETKDESTPIDITPEAITCLTKKVR